MEKNIFVDFFFSMKAEKQLYVEVCDVVAMRTYTHLLLDII